jgi:hypothetical protein
MMKNSFTNLKEIKYSFWGESFYSFRLFLGFLIGVSIITFCAMYQSFKIDEEMKSLSQKYKILGHDELLITKGFSTRQNMMLKIKILSELKPKPEILFIGNHQMQYFGTGFSKTVSPHSFFNLWLGNLGITEIADVTSYLDKNLIIPKKALVVMITTPNNDNGDCIVGYRDELPEEMFQLHKTKEQIDEINKIKNNWRFRTLRYQYDYKKIMGLINGIKIEIVPQKVSVLSQFQILKNGASAFHGDHYENKPPIKNEYPLEENKSHLKEHHISEIRNSIRHIDRIANKNGIQAIIVIPPVYEDHGRISFADKILSRALNEGILLKSTIIIDHRQFPEKTDPAFFYRYDHPSSRYGDFLYKKILKILEKSNSLN